MPYAPHSWQYSGGQSGVQRFPDACQDACLRVQLLQLRTRLRKNRYIATYVHVPTYLLYPRVTVMSPIKPYLNVMEMGKVQILPFVSETAP